MVREDLIMDRPLRDSYNTKKQMLKLVCALVLLNVVVIILVVIRIFQNAGDAPMYVVAGSEGHFYGEVSVYPHSDEESGNLYFFLPGKKDSSDYRLYIEKAKEIKIGNKSYHAGDKLDKSIITYAGEGNKRLLENGNSYTLVKKNGDVAEGKIFFMCGGDVETFYISASKNHMEAVDEDPQHKTRAAATFEIYDSGNVKESAGALKISGHGNSTWTELMEEFPGREFKRSYNISFDSAKEILGMSAAKSFVLLSNFYDESEAKSYIVLDTARKLGMENVPDCKYANLYINGEYRGLYLVAKKIKEGNGFLDLSSDGYLAKFDYEERVKADGNVFTQINNNFAEIVYPGKPSSKELEDITNDLTTLENAISSGEFTNLVDEESFVKFYLIQEFFENGDADRASQYVYKAGMDNKLIAGPVWDFDLTMGHPWFSYDGAEINALWIKGLVDEKGWLRQLSNDDAFMGKICRYYRDYFSDVIEKEMDSTFPLVMYKIESSFYMDMIRYERGPEYYDKFDYAKYGYDRFDSLGIIGETKNWVMARKSFWDGYVKNPDEYEVFITEPGKGTKSIRSLIVMKNKRENIK